VREPFLERFHAYADAHVLGDSRDPATTMSALIHPIMSRG
jgi:betaine-aldehyde dehydrogenase/5-carboxymethyl-2-hydroxymuconic-semialdehyde dehydrogenase